MKHLLPGFVALTSVIALACSPRAEAGHSVRADLPYPYGGGGGPVGAAWTLTSATPIGFAGISTPFNYALISNSTIGNDQVGEVVEPKAIQFDTYAAAVRHMTTAHPLPRMPRGR